MAVTLMRTLVPCRHASGWVNATLSTFSRPFSAQSADTSSSESKKYIVWLRQPSGIDVGNPEEVKRWYHPFMSGGKKSGIGADKDPRIVTTFSGVCMTGFAARLTRDEALPLKSHDDFLLATPF
ncbi:hypothetical protein OROGR_026064 [Orobanche gracilis]